MAMSCYIRLRRESVFREQLERNYGPMGTDCIMVYGDRELPGRVKPGQILLLPVHQFGGSVSPKGQALLLQPVPSHSLLQESKGKGVPGPRVFNSVGRRA